MKIFKYPIYYPEYKFYGQFLLDSIINITSVSLGQPVCMEDSYITYYSFVMLSSVSVWKSTALNIHFIKES